MQYFTEIQAKNLRKIANKTFDLPHLGYWVEHHKADAARATCRVCRKKIKKGERSLRFGFMGNHYPEQFQIHQDKRACYRDALALREDETKILKERYAMSQVVESWSDVETTPQDVSDVPLWYVKGACNPSVANNVVIEWENIDDTRGHIGRCRFCGDTLWGAGELNSTLVEYRHMVSLHQPQLAAIRMGQF